MSTGHHGYVNDHSDDARIAELMQRFNDQVERRTKRAYPEGRVGGDDEGALAFAVAADQAHGIVRIDFGKPVEWIGLGPKDCVALAQLLIQKAREVSTEPLVVTV